MPKKALANNDRLLSRQDTLKVIDQYVLAHCEAVRRAVRDNSDLPGPILPLVIGGWASGEQEISPARIQRLRPLLFQLPPIISRNKVGDYLGGVISATHLRNRDQLKTGPRVRIVGGRKVSYPTAYLLEWMEEEGFDVRINL